jgi:plastocyanin
MYKKLFLSLAVFSVLTVLLASCAIVDTANLSNGPTVHMGGSTFIQTSVTVKKGDMVNLVDDSSAQHIIVNGFWVNGAPKPGAESGAPSVNKTFNGNDSSPIGPFNTAGTFHFYCTIHQNMNLTVNVQ